MTTLAIQSFAGNEIRIFGTPDAPLFVAADVCRVLGLTNPTVAISALDSDERAKLNLGQGETNVITESGLYTLILRSRDAVTPGSKPHAFRKWVTGVVLPSIRKTGSHSVFKAPSTLSEALFLAGQQAAENERLALENGRLNEDVARMEPKERLFDAAMDSKTLLLVRDAAKLLNDVVPGGIGERRLFAWLRTNKWIFPGTNKPYQSKVDAGYLSMREMPVLTRNHGTIINITPYITQRGLEALRKSLVKSFAGGVK